MSALLLVIVLNELEGSLLSRSMVGLDGQSTGILRVAQDDDSVGDDSLYDASDDAL